jgi:hypothetical protein
VIIGAFTPLADGTRTELAYRALFLCMGVVLMIAALIYSRSQDVRPSEEVRLRAGMR